MKTAIEIIDETVEFYAADPAGRRSKLSSGGCLYFGLDEKRCAVGRCFKDSITPDMVKENETPAYLPLNDLLKEDYLNLPERFWSDLQEFHDTDDYWNLEGLTPEGKDYVYGLKTRYKI